MKAEQPGSAQEGTQLPSWVTETINKYALDVKPPATVAEMRTWPEIALVAFYRQTRHSRTSRKLARLAEDAVMERYRDLIRKFAGESSGPTAALVFKNAYQELPSGVDRGQGMWTSLFEAMEKYDPTKRGEGGRSASFHTYAQNYLNNQKGKLFQGSYNGPVLRDEALRLYVPLGELTVRLRTENGREPSLAEIATELSQNPDLIERNGSAQAVHELAMEALINLLTPVASADEQPDEGDEAPAPLAIPSDFALPEATLLFNEERAINHELINRMFEQAQQRLGAQGARQLLVLRILLGVSAEHIPQQHDPNKPPPPRPEFPKALFNLRKIASQLNNPRSNMIATWAWLAAAWQLDRYGLPYDWREVCQWFQPGLGERDLSRLYSFALKRSDLVGHARVLDDAELFVASFRHSDLYKETCAAWAVTKSFGLIPLPSSPLFENSAEAGMTLLRFHLTVCRLIWNESCYVTVIRKSIKQYFSSVRKVAELPPGDEPLTNAVSAALLKQCAPELNLAAATLVDEGKVNPLTFARAVVDILLVSRTTPVR